MRLLLVVSLFALLAAPAAAQTPVDTTPTITTDGATLTPDLADITAGVSRLTADRRCP